MVGDTAMPNGHHYAVLSDWSYPSFMRQEGDSVFIYSPNGEWLSFDFSRAPRDTIITNAGRPGDTVFVVTTARDTFLTFGSRRCTWMFFFDNPRGYDEERSYRVVDSIGITDVYVGFGMWYNFQGARVNGVVYGNLTTVQLPSNEIPHSFRLEQNYPNPFNPSTTIRYALPRRSHVSLVVFNTLGQQVTTLVNGEVDTGFHEVKFDAGGLASGVYFYRLSGGSYAETKKFLLLR